MNFFIYTLLILCISAKIHGSVVENSPDPMQCVTNLPETKVVKTVKYDHKTHKKEVNLSLGKSMCGTRDTLVDVVPPSENILYVPSKVVVKRCDGAAFGKKACMPTNSVPKHYTVLTMDALDLNKKEMSAVIVEIEEHTKCKVGCLIQREHCNDKQTFMPDTCMCVCTKMTPKECTIHMRWDPNECKCICQDRRVCSTGHSFDFSSCSCVSDENVLDYEEELTYK